eukprot:gb/GFBE01001803.1/.p1 GENE.gb/GFBE01001803.1/~~gb/GFBE01001803.1/.p1  ORF type:complete len:150 (+),score=31.34 gb/GFBE01001803.1/:1-450(+)
MYFLTSGRLWYKRPSLESQKFQSGEWVDPDEDWISEPGLWLTNWEHLGSATATRASTVIKVASSGLQEVIKGSPVATWAFIKEYASRFAEWLESKDFEELSDILQAEDHADQIRAFIPQIADAIGRLEALSRVSMLKRAVQLPAMRSGR